MSISAQILLRQTRIRHVSLAVCPYGAAATIGRRPFVRRHQLLRRRGRRQGSRRARLRARTLARNEPPLEPARVGEQNDDDDEGKKKKGAEDDGADVVKGGAKGSRGGARGRGLRVWGRSFVLRCCSCEVEVSVISDIRWN